MEREAGLPPRRALAALLPLLRQTVSNLEKAGLPAALTGPVARGEAETVARHAALLSRRGHGGAPATLHRELVLRTIELARSAGWIDPESARRIRKSLGHRRER